MGEDSNVHPPNTQAVNGASSALNHESISINLMCYKNATLLVYYKQEQTCKNLQYWVLRLLLHKSLLVQHKPMQILTILCGTSNNNFKINIEG